MSFSLIVRFVIVCGILMTVLWFALPYVGVAPVRILPPNLVYQAATGGANGRVTGKRTDQTNDPFHVGDSLYFVDYDFYADAPNPKAPAQPGKKQEYDGSARVDKEYYDAAAQDQIVSVKYDKTAPDINGVNEQGAGQGCAGGSNMLGSWIAWDLGILLVSYMILARFARTSDL